MTTITLTHEEKAITAQAIQQALGYSYKAEQIGTVTVHAETVEILTPGGICAIGKAFFKQLVQQIKAAAKERKVQSVTQLSDKLYEVVGSTGNRYIVSGTSCSCKAAKYGKTCYHVKAVPNKKTYRSLTAKELKERVARL